MEVSVGWLRTILRRLEILKEERQPRQDLRFALEPTAHMKPADDRSVRMLSRISHPTLAARNFSLRKLATRLRGTMIRIRFHDASRANIAVHEDKIRNNFPHERRNKLHGKRVY